MTEAEKLPNTQKADTDKSVSAFIIARKAFWDHTSKQNYSKKNF